MVTTTSRPPAWRDVRVLAWVFQLAVVAVVVAVVAWILDNYRVNADRLNVPTSFDFLDQPSSFPIPANPEFRQTQPVKDALVEGLLNTLRLVVFGIIAATVLGTLLGIARLSKNFLVRNAARVYVEFVRNVPLFILLLLMYRAIVLQVPPRRQESWDLGPLAVINVQGTNALWFEGSNVKFVAVIAVTAIAVGLVVLWRRQHAERHGGLARPALYALPIGAAVLVSAWLLVGLGVTAPTLTDSRASGGIRMTPEYLGAFLALVIYTSSHIAEIVRGSIQAVPRGQGEAADSLALSGFQRMWFVVLPQAMRIAVPPIGNQFLNLSKNSSLAAAISFAELTKITQLTVANRSPAVPAFALLLGIYLVISLVLSLFVNLANRRLAIVER